MDHLERANVPLSDKELDIIQESLCWYAYSVREVHVKSEYTEQEINETYTQIFRYLAQEING